MNNERLRELDHWLASAELFFGESKDDHFNERPIIADLRRLVAALNAAQDAVQQTRRDALRGE